MVAPVPCNVPPQDVRYHLMAPPMLPKPAPLAVMLAEPPVQMVLLNTSLVADDGAVGAVLFTVTVNEHVAVNPAASVAV